MAGADFRLVFATFYAFHDTCSQMFDRKDNFVCTIGGEGDGDGKFSGPAGVCFDTFGNLFVCDSGNHRVQAFTADGQFICRFGEKGTGDGQFGKPTAVRFNNAGQLLIADNENNRIQVWSIVS